MQAHNPYITRPAAIISLVTVVTHYRTWCVLASIIILYRQRLSYWYEYEDTE